MNTAAQINLPQTGQVELPVGVKSAHRERQAAPPAPELPLEAVSGVVSLPLEITLTWQPVTKPPLSKDTRGIYCVSTPADGKTAHQLAQCRDGGWFTLNGVCLTGAVTFWCGLPPSPEYMAAHPEEFEDVEE
jgi:hypothetical protein